jgi:hypothetical protein
MMVAVDFSPRMRPTGMFRRGATAESAKKRNHSAVASRRARFGMEYRGMNPTATLIRSLRDSAFMREFRDVTILSGLRFRKVPVFRVISCVSWFQLPNFGFQFLVVGLQPFFPVS